MPRQDRARATRECILRAAAEEFERVGYAATSLRAVLERGGVTKGAFYFHFASKEAVATELIRKQREYAPRVRLELEEAGLDPLRLLVETVSEVTTRISDDVVTRAGFRLAAERGLAHPDAPTPYGEWERVLGRWLADAQRGGLLRPGVDVSETAQVLNSMIVGARLVSFSLNRCKDYPRRVASMWELMLPQIASEEWLVSWRAGRNGG